MSDRWRLFLLSFLMLFVELALIRWLGANVVYLSYFSNFVLLGSFLGIGLGFLRAQALPNLFPWAIVEIVFLVGFFLAFPVTIDRSGSALVYFGFATKGLPIWIILPIIFVSTAIVMASIAQGVARVFGKFEPLEAYRLDILGSLAGIVVFALLAFISAPPIVWACIVTVLCLSLSLPGVRMLQVGAGIALVLILGKQSFDPHLTWSPYYKIALFQTEPDVYDLEVNGVPHQWIESKANRKRNEPLYFVPYARLRTTPRNVLIIGAGSGGDVAIALAAGAQHVDAVEIDPRIYELGTRLNPDRPYAQQRVERYIDDGRAYLQRTNKRYDLILLALPDSLALVSGQSSLRLESYLFTLEAIRATRAHLTPRGAFGMYNYYRQRWLVDRFAETLKEAYGQSPCIDAVGENGWFALLMVGREPGNVACATTWSPADPLVAPPARDDYPFPYLRNRSIPLSYCIVLASILLISALSIRGLSGPFQRMRSYADLFFMGAAFLLLETKNVVQFALLFGTTWLVNALVFAGILLSVLAAIETARRFRFRAPYVLYGALFASLVLAWVVEPGALLALSVGPRFAAAVALAFAPIFIANVIFAARFREVSSSTIAFGTNLLGAMLGGVLEYAALVVGYRDLLLFVALFYAFALILTPYGKRRAEDRASEFTPNSSAELV